MREPQLGSDAKGAFAAAVVLALLAVAIGDGTVAWLLAPAVLGLIWFAMSRAPLRSSLLVLTFCAFALENPSESPAAGKWKGPLWMLGSVMLEHLNRSTGIDALFMSGMDIMLGSLGVVALFRRSSGVRTGLATPKPLITLAYVSLAGAAYAWVVGQIRSGDSGIALWQLDRVVYLPCVFLLFQAALRGPQDLPAFAKVALTAATLRASQAVYVQYAVERDPNPYTGERMFLQYATTHHDSMLFAFACVLLVVAVIQRVDAKALQRLLLVAPVLLTGMYYNNRRMVWVQLLIVFFVLYLVTPPNAVKRKLQKALKWLSPVGLAYVVAGWQSGHKLFKPVQTIRSAVVSDVNASTQWRDVENVDLIFTIRTHPIFGTGYGHGFYEVVPLPVVEYPLERFIPHNSILGLWAYTGIFGYTALTLLWIAGVYFAMRAYHASTVARDKAAALACVAAVVIYYVQCYGDMGLGSWTGVFMIAPAIAAAGKLAVASGAWPVRSAGAQRAAPERAPAPAATRAAS